MSKLHIVIPAAGNGQRFRDAGYDKPKPYIDVCGRPMIDRVIENLTPDREHVLHVLMPEMLKRPSRGAVETIVQADVDPEAPLLIANCDQLVAFDVNDFINTDLDGRIVTFRSTKDHHSYVDTEDGLVRGIVEKEVVGNQAVTGVYYFKRARDFYDAAYEVIAQDKRVKNEYYVSSAIEIMLEAGARIGTYEAPSAMLGTPDELQLFEAAAVVAKDVL